MAMFGVSGSQDGGQWSYSSSVLEESLNENSAEGAKARLKYSDNIAKCLTISDKGRFTWNG